MVCHARFAQSCKKIKVLPTWMVPVLGMLHTFLHPILQVCFYAVVVLHQLAWAITENCGQALPAYSLRTQMGEEGCNQIDFAPLAISETQKRAGIKVATYPPTVSIIPKWG